MVSNYFKRKIANIVSCGNAKAIQKCLVDKCVSLDKKCVRLWTLTNSGFSQYIFASLMGEGDTESTIITVAFRAFNEHTFDPWYSVNIRK